MHVYFKQSLNYWAFTNSLVFYNTTELFVLFTNKIHKTQKILYKVYKYIIYKLAPYKDVFAKNYFSQIVFIINKYKHPIYKSPILNLNKNLKNYTKIFLSKIIIYTVL